MYSVVLVDGGVFVSVNNRNFLLSLLLIDIDDTLWKKAVMMMILCPAGRLSLRFQLNFISHQGKQNLGSMHADISGIVSFSL